MTDNPLLFLAHVALNTTGDTSEVASTSSSRQTSLVESPTPFVITSLPTRNLTSTIHIPSIPFEASTERRALKRSNTSNSLRIPRAASSVPICKANSRKKQTQRSLRLQRTIKTELRARQKENLARATRIKSLENSPVNDRQLSVLRMVYDEITMYPSEPWMALLAIALHRALKQVKNWFSNERQKNRTGDSISVFTDAGDKVRLRPLALQLRSDWSDSFFEEVVMIYHYKIQRCMREAQMAVSNPDICP